MAIKTGLQVYQKLGINDILLYSDSLDALNYLMRGSGVDHPYREDIEETRQLIYEHWNLEINYGCRETLQCADFLARIAHNVTDELILLNEVPESCKARILVDKHGMREGVPSMS
ncbi:uncharacterized protein LOC114721666 [Neltuma alba]|uniref:uncharacterized protein LOC114721666 n=1 Tax=Neltuma alba TaxID=207710 RepID=UPI0010A3E809|nr:uncharacterized protein LOC114721666 [Prosopis alba]